MSKKSRKPTCNGPLHLQTLGSALITYPAGGECVTTLVRAGKPVALLAFIAAAPNRTASKQKLVDLLWPDLIGEPARHALRQTLWSIRKKLGTDIVITTNHEVTLGSRLRSDREAFLEAVQGVELERAVHLFGGEYLDGLSSIGLDFEQWVDQERYRLRLIYRRTAEVVVRRRMAEGQFRSALELARRLHEVDARYLGGWRLLIETLLSAGDHVAAKSEADALEERFLTEDRQLDPATAAVIRLVKQIPAEARHAGSDVAADLVGREREFHAAWSAWTEALNGRTVHARILGVPGTGRTRLLHDLGQRLRATGASVVHVRAHPGERTIDFGLAAHLAGKVGELPGATGISPGSARCLVALNPTLTTFFNGVTETNGETHGLRQRSLALGELLAAVADENPIAVLIDDLHWSDPSSRQMLQAALGRMVDERILFVTTGHWSANPSLDWPAGRQVILKPFTAAQVRTLMAGIAPLGDLPWVDPVVEAITRTSGGLPQLVIETIQNAVEAGQLTRGPEGWRCLDPAALERAVEQDNPLQRRVYQLEPALRWLLTTICVAGWPIPARLLVDAAGRRDEWAFADLGTLERHGLILETEAGWIPAHPEIVERTLEAAPRGATQTAHRSLAHVLTEHDGTADALYRAASHWAAAGDRSALMSTFRRWVVAKRRTGDQRGIGEMAREYAGPIEWLVAPSELAQMETARPTVTRPNVPTPVHMPTAQAALLILVGVVLGFSAARLLRDAPPIPARAVTVSDSLFAQEPPAPPVPVVPVSWQDSAETPHLTTDRTPPER